MDWKKAISTVAPTLARAVGGPIGSVALNVLSAALGIDPDPATLEKRVEKLTAGDLLALKNAEYQFQKDMRELELDVDRIEAADRASARDREIKTSDSWTPRILAGIVVGGFLFTVYMVLTGYVSGLKDPMTASLVGTLIGYVSAKADQVVGYYFGSSAGSKAKDDTIKDLKKR